MANSIKINANKRTDTNPRRKQPFSFNLVEQKRRGRTLPATINGLTAAQAQTQGLVIEDNSDNEGSAANDGESLFLPDQTGSTRLAREPTVNGVTPSVTSTQEEKGEVASKASPLFQFKPSTPSFPTSEKPHDTPTGIWSFGKPSGPISSTQPTNPVDTPSFDPSKPANYSPFSDLNKPETKPGPFSNLNQPDSTPSSLNNSKKPNTTPGLFGFSDRQDSTVPTFTTAGSTGQAHQDPSSTSSPSRSIFDAKPNSTASSTKISFGTSPLFSQNEIGKSTQPEKKDEISNSSPAASAPPAAYDLQPSGSPFAFLKHAKPIAPSSPLPPQAPDNHIEKKPAQRSLPPPFSSPIPPSALASGSHFQSTQQSNHPDANSNLDFTRPIATSSTPFSFFPPKTTENSPEQRKDQTAPTTATPAFKTQQLTSTKSPPSNRAGDPSEAAVATTPPNPRPAVLDALAESLMMDDRGLLQQFIEYTVGPIVHHAFLEVEDDRSWHQAR